VSIEAGGPVGGVCLPGIGVPRAGAQEERHGPGEGRGQPGAKHADYPHVHGSAIRTSDGRITNDCKGMKTEHRGLGRGYPTIVQHDRRKTEEKRRILDGFTSAGVEAVDLFFYLLCSPMRDPFL